MFTNKSIESPKFYKDLSDKKLELPNQKESYHDIKGRNSRKNLAQTINVDNITDIKLDNSTIQMFDIEKANKRTLKKLKHHTPLPRRQFDISKLENSSMTRFQNRTKKFIQPEWRPASLRRQNDIIPSESTFLLTRNLSKKFMSKKRLSVH